MIGRSEYARYQLLCFAVGDLGGEYRLEWYRLFPLGFEVLDQLFVLQVDDIGPILQFWECRDLRILSLSCIRRTEFIPAGDEAVLDVDDSSEMSLGGLKGLAMIDSGGKET